MEKMTQGIPSGVSLWVLHTQNREAVFASLFLEKYYSCHHYSYHAIPSCLVAQPCMQHQGISVAPLALNISLFLDPLPPHSQV